MVAVAVFAQPFIKHDIFRKKKKYTKVYTKIPTNTIKHRMF